MEETVHRFGILAAAALLAACTPTTTPVASQADIQADYARQTALEAGWRQNNPGYDQATQPLSPTEMQVAHERERIMRAAALECRYQANAATVNLANDGSLFYGVINQGFQANQLYAQCMQMQAARMGY